MTPGNITSEQFILWRKGLGMSQAFAAKRLGISMSSVYSYETGKRKEGEVKIPLLVCLGMSAICNNLQPYEGEKKDADSNQSGSEDKE